VNVPPSSIVGRTLVDVLASARPLSGRQIPGLERPLYYDVVLLLDSGERLSLSGSALTAWRGTGELAPVTPATFSIDPVVVFRNQAIVAVTEDDEGDLVVVLANHTTLSVRVSFGTVIDLACPS
jgi:hypothetical protein